MDKPSIWGPPQQEKKFFSKFIRFYLILLAIFIAFILGLVSGRQSYKVVTDSVDMSGQIYNKNVKPQFLSKDINFKLFWDAWEIIEQNYVKQPVDESLLFYGAIAGSVASLGDPHSVFFDPEITNKFKEELSGSFEGIGAEIAIKNDRITVISPLTGTPAEKAGLKSGDKIYAIDGQDTTGMSLDYAVSKIRGPKGTEVVLTIARDGLDDINEYKIVREKIQIQSVKWQMLDDNIVHLELRYFNEDTESEFNKAILAILAKNPQGIIFDLRNNPGGFLETAISVAGEWIEDGVVVYERFRDGKLQAHTTKGRARLRDFPTVILINAGSASGSEIVAGALQDFDLATLVGEKTFGKGSVQTLFALDDGSAIKLTIAEWLTPNQNTIDGDGVEPDIEIKLTEEDFSNDKDPQVDKAKELILEKIK